MTRPVVRGAVGTLFLWVMSATPGLAQDGALVIHAHGSYFAPLSSLSDTTDDLAPSVAYGGGVGVQLGGRVAIRGDLTIVATRYRGPTATVNPDGIGRLYVFGDLQVGWPGTSNLVPYVLVGAGAVRNAPRDPTQPSTWSPAGRGGVGVNYLSGLGAVFVEVHAVASRFASLGFSKLQLDLAVHTGLAFAIPF
ncbi:MAG TPA: hypothetical protein VGA22_05790 [Gemmatimonadales bacterium]|jgi:hypothetical protein